MGPRGSFGTKAFSGVVQFSEDECFIGYLGPISIGPRFCWEGQVAQTGRMSRSRNVRHARLVVQQWLFLVGWKCHVQGCDGT